MNFKYGDTLRIENDLYTVLGTIAYENKEGYSWVEHLLIEHRTDTEYWLSKDDGSRGYENREYQLSRVVSTGIIPDGMRLVDSGRERVTDVWDIYGSDDVERGDEADYKKYRNDKGMFFSIEKWEDCTEYSRGRYIDEKVVQIEKNAELTDFIKRQMLRRRLIKTGIFLFFVVGICILLYMGYSMRHDIRDFFGYPYTVAEYVKDKPGTYTYVTSVTDANNTKSDIYQSDKDLDATVQDIIKGVDGKVSEVTQDGDTALANMDSQADEELTDLVRTTGVPTQTVTILTDNEFITVYISTEGTVLLRVESREAAYNNTDDGGYHSTTHSYGFYRYAYWRNGYDRDRGRYGGTSSYASYTPGSSHTTYSPYNQYASSVRRNSVSSRTGSHGGTSVGK